MTRIVAMSDTHMKYPDVPDGDILIHAGDATYQGSQKECEEFFYWFAELPHRHKLFVPGNHDWWFQTHPKESEELFENCCDVLIDSAIHYDGINFWGSPYQPVFYDWAFNLPRGKALKEHWDLIPAGIDILVTHSPPYGIMDNVGGERYPIGCQDMREMVDRIKPRVHMFGHVHSTHGTLLTKNTVFCNVAICNEKYQPTNKVTVFDYESNFS